MEALIENHNHQEVPYFQEARKNSQCTHHHLPYK